MNEYQKMIEWLEANTVVNSRLADNQDEYEDMKAYMNKCFASLKKMLKESSGKNEY